MFFSLVKRLMPFCILLFFPPIWQNYKFVFKKQKNNQQNSPQAPGPGVRGQVSGKSPHHENVVRGGPEKVRRQLRQLDHDVPEGRGRVLPLPQVEHP